MQQIGKSNAVRTVSVRNSNRKSKVRIKARLTPRILASHGSLNYVTTHSRSSACKSRAQKRGWGQLGAGSVFFTLTYRTLILFLVVLVELFRNCVFQSYCLKDYYKQKQCNSLLVTMITEIMNFNRLLWWLPWH